MADVKATPLSTFTDENGLATLRCPADWQNASVKANHPESATAKAIAFLPVFDPIEIELIRAGTVFGEVVMEGAGSPVAGAAVQVYNMKNHNGHNIRYI